MKIGIIGAGWYGCHMAIALKKAGYEVILYEKNPEIFSQISGSFGIRLHAGPHYPRSKKTRESCQRGFREFIERYPELVIPHEYSVYGLGAKDAENRPSKVTQEEFHKVCYEAANCHELDLKTSEYKELISAYSVEEPSITLGEELRQTFMGYLLELGIQLHCNFEITKLEFKNSKIYLGNDHSLDVFDKVINATSYQAFQPELADFPFDVEILYQPCLALLYKDTAPSALPFSFIVMDGWFPCLMPYISNKEPANPTQLDSFHRNYILTHGKWTIMGTYYTATEARTILSQLTDEFVEEWIKKPSEHEMRRFWPGFKTGESERFEYIGWKGEVTAKIKTKREFRSAVTFEKNSIIQIIPGKVSNVFDVEHEIFSLLQQKNITECAGYLYMKNGVLDESIEEITEKPATNEPNTLNLQTYRDLQSQAFLPQI